MTYQNYGESLKFLDLLFGHVPLVEQHATNLTLTAMRANTKTRRTQGSLTASSRHIPPADTEQIALAIEQGQEANAQGMGLFASVALVRPGLPKFKRGEKQDIRLVPALWCDLDDQAATPYLLRTLNNLLPPNMLVSSSREGSHAYWLLDDPTPDVARVDRLLKALAVRLGGCHFAATQPMRLPGTTNTKPNRNTPCRIVAVNNHVLYELADIEQVFPVPKTSPQPTKTRVAETSAPKHTKRRCDPLKPDLLDEIKNIILSRYDGRLKTNGWIAARCPFDHNQDCVGSHFNYNPQIGLGHCFGNHGSVLTRDLCGAIGVDLRRYGDSIYLK